MNQIFLAFLTGLTSGGISCLAVQGSFLTSAITNKANAETKNWKIVLSFLLAKLLVYTLLGTILGILGSTLRISPLLQAIIQLLVGVFLLLTVGRVLNLHPIFRKFTLEPPKSFYLFLRRKSLNASYFTPVILGLLTVIVPCGITQGIMLIAVSSQSALTGGLIMLAFVLGTFPVFFLLGIGLAQLLKNELFSYLTAILILIMAVLSIRSGFNLLGIKTNFFAGSGSVGTAQIKNGKQYVTITVKNTAYEASTTTLKSGVPVVLKLVTRGVTSCSRAFTIPSLRVSKVLPATGEETVEFTPTKTGTLVYSCSMGMYSGSFQVIQ